MSTGSGGGRVAAPAFPASDTNPMPALTSEVREALVASIREHGVICPVVKDQTGFIIDGYNRDAIATELGITYPETVHHCTPDDREILRIELNGARRQITAKQWQPLVDHLRSLRTASGHKFSDRAIAQAVGVSKDAVHRYKADVAPATSATKTATKDGKVRNKDPEWSAVDRVLHLIRQSTTGLTAADLRSDSVLSGFGPSTISKIPTELCGRGLIAADGKRDRSTVWKAVETPVAPPPKEPTKSTTPKTISRKVDQIFEGLKDPEVRVLVRQGLSEGKGNREALAVLAAAEKELDAALLAAEKQKVDEEKARLKQVEANRQSASTSIKTWETLAAEVSAAWKMIAAYSKIIDDLPAIHPAFERTLGRELTELRRQLDRIEDRLYPNRNHAGPIKAGTIIDVG